MTARSVRPSSDELEVSVFGPGRGECILVHVPNGPWFAIDSLLVRDGAGGHVPVVQAYLKDVLGVNELWGLFLTHWHDDHTRGAGAVINAFSSSLRLVGLPDGFGKREFASFAADRLPDELRSKEIKDIVGVLAALRNTSDIETVQLSARVQLSNDPNWALECLSPSFDDIRHHAQTLARFLPNYTGPAPSASDPNSGCAVLRLEAAGRVVMFCSDLDIGGVPTRGWDAIHATRQAILPSDIVKIGHHGSKTALSEAAWKAFSQNGPPKGVVTPFPASGGRLPREPESTRFRALCSEVHITAPAKSSTKAGAVSLDVTPFSSYVNTSPKKLDGTGQVRYRAKVGQPLSVEVFPPAKTL